MLASAYENLYAAPDEVWLDQDQGDERGRRLEHREAAPRGGGRRSISVPPPTAWGATSVPLSLVGASSPPRLTLNSQFCTQIRSIGQEEDLEDGEIFDDEESELEANTQAAAKATVGKAAAQTEMKEPAVVSNNKKKKESKKTGSPPGLEKKEKRHSSNSSSTSTKPKRKRVRDDEDPESNRFNPKPNKSRRSRDLDKRDEEVDEHELLGMRGGNSPPLSKPNHHHDNHWDRFDSQGRLCNDLFIILMG
ncbi:hypothetical protein AAG570_004520 [Ranatra chinensis]|uniref:Uncharacterized protein n=1 Tax=Ranatra chinensis TaxID=642074 RepID=A0ABD0YFS6_9HEMI